MEFISRIWTNVIIKNRGPFIILIIIFTIIFNKLGSRGLSHYMNMNNESIYYYNYTLGFYGLIMLIPAALISLVLVITWLKLSEVYSSSAILNKIGRGLGVTLKGLFKGLFIVVKSIFIVVKWLVMIPILIISGGGKDPRSKLRRDLEEAIRRSRY